MMKVIVDYPSIDEEKEIINRANTQNDKKIKSVVKGNILEAQNLVNDIYIDSKISEYILNIVFATRDPKQFNLSKLADLISFGASQELQLIWF